MEKTRKVISVVKIQDDRQLKQLVREGNNCFFKAFPKCSEEVCIRLSKTTGNKRMWLVYYCATDEQQEFDINESLTGEYSWLKRSIEEGRFYCKIYNK